MSGQTLTVVSSARARLAGGKGFASLDLMTRDAVGQRARCSEVQADPGAVFFTSDEGRLGVELGGGAGALNFTPWALRQVGGLCGVPAGVVDRLQPATAARVLNETYPRQGDGAEPRRFLLESGLVVPEGGSVPPDLPPTVSTLRAVTSTGYRRVWDADLLGEVSRWLAPAGWEAAYPERNVGGKVEDRERALWRTDRESFAFFMGARDMGKGDGSTDWDGLGGMRRGLFIGNSETGARSLSWGTFWFRALCCNFLVWNAEEVNIRRRRHTAGVVSEVHDLRRWIRDVAPVEVTSEALAPFLAVKDRPFPVDAIQSKAWAERAADVLADRFGFTRAEAKGAAEYAEAGKDATRPGSWWAVVNGLTAGAKDRDPGDRFDLSRKAGAVMTAALQEVGA